MPLNFLKLVILFFLIITFFSCNSDLDFDGRHSTNLDVKFIVELSKKSDTVRILNGLEKKFDSVSYVQHIKHFLVVGKFPRKSTQIDSLVFSFLDTCQVARNFIIHNKKVEICFYLLEEKFYKMGESYLGKNGVNIDGEKEIAILHFENKKLAGFGYSTDLDTSYNTGYAHYIEPIDRLHFIEDSAKQKSR